MLKRLELVGFKSFAEKTLFDFGPGVTAIVGPNGSGKSNVVDAVRWILGEQSAKSLRGGEMADVIFNGSSTRRSLGLAEVTLTLDNSKRQLGIDADEIQVTRRVYRSGEGEYLINKQPARLRDIKEMFLGSGAGADAYCIIAQGRVEAMLQSSTRDRRTIFEEAAGISRFKAKKVETQRKLEHVDQNLQRARDIIDEVDRQLKSVRLQAAKAQRFQEYKGRLQELRVAISLDEHHQLVQQLTGVTDTLQRLRQEFEAQAKLTIEGEEELRGLDQRLMELDERLRAADASLAAARAGISTGEATLSHERSLMTTLEEELAHTRIQAQAVNVQLAALDAALARAEDERSEVDAKCAAQAQVAAEREADLAETSQRLKSLRQQSETDKKALLEQMRLVASLHNEQVSLEAQIRSLQQHRQRLQNRTAHASASLEQIDGQVQQLAAAEDALQQRLTALRQQQVELRRQREETRLSAEVTTRQLDSLREERSGLTSRLEVLETLERSREGLNAGVRQVLDLVDAPNPGPWSTVIGLVADLLSAPSEHAALIDLALGDRAHWLLIRDAQQLSQALRTQIDALAGRVTFLLRPETPARGLTEPALALRASIVARATELVHSAHEGLVDHLLGSTLIVEDLDAAKAIVATGRGWRCLTLQGELLEANGVLTVGQHHAGSGMLSRKSELRELRERGVILDQQLTVQERQLNQMREQLSRLDSQGERLQQEVQVLNEQLADLRSRLQQQRQKHQGLAEEVKLSSLEVSQLDGELAKLTAASAEVQERRKRAGDEEARLQQALAEADGAVPALEQQRHQQQQAATAARIDLATAEERRRAVVARHDQLRYDCEQRQQDATRAQQQLRSLTNRLDQNQLTLLRTSAALAQAFLEKEQAQQRSGQLQHDATALRVERQTKAEATQASRQHQQALQDQLHGRELEASDVRHRLEGLAARLKEEHELDLQALYQDYQAPEKAVDQAAALEEIAELRKKIARLGSVSLDALQELQELEARSKSLQTQHDDLLKAKLALEEIINKINQDSRKLFADTLETVRGHFQELFRKLFGGGMADIILEDPNDILESGIEINARPPGKELRSISLLSGGEKTLTAVALLLAIFRSRPSPFCILDEVDAALDEANTGRFAAVLRDFLDRSQFIMITHSKKTMVAADVLYGITMQEAGVSKRVAVRLDEWPEAPRPLAA